MLQWEFRFGRIEVPEHLLHIIGEETVEPELGFSACPHPVIELKLGDQHLFRHDDRTVLQDHGRIEDILVRILRNIPEGGVDVILVGRCHIELHRQQIHCTVSYPLRPVLQRRFRPFYGAAGACGSPGLCRIPCNRCPQGCRPAVSGLDGMSGIRFMPARRKRIG